MTRYGTLVAQFGDTLPAGAADTITGFVTVTPGFAYALDTDTTPPKVVLPAPQRVPLTAAGFELETLGTDAPGVNPEGWTYQLDFDVHTGSTQWDMPPVSVLIPAGKTSDLALSAPVPSNPGTPITKGDPGEQGDPGPANTLTMGTVTEGPAAATITGEAPHQTLNLSIPKGAKGDSIKGDTGPANKLTMGTVTEGPAAATITGTAPNQTLNLTVPKGAKGDAGGLTEPVGLMLTDLDTQLQPGTFINNTAANGTLARHYPVEGVAGILVVYGLTNSFRTQIFYPANGAMNQGVFWVRLFNVTWTPWRAYTKARVDKTAGTAVYQWDDVANREQLVYGDSGVRDINALLGVTNGNVRIARNNYGVNVSFADVVLGALAGTQDLPAMPPGFFPRSNETMIGFMNGKTIRVLFGSALTRFYGLEAGMNINGSLFFRTAEPWPTSLPGTAVGTVPNV